MILGLRYEVGRQSHFSHDSWTELQAHAYIVFVPHHCTDDLGSNPIMGDNYNYILGGVGDQMQLVNIYQTCLILTFMIIFYFMKLEQHPPGHRRWLW